MSGTSQTTYLGPRDYLLVGSGSRQGMVRRLARRSVRTLVREVAEERGLTENDIYGWRKDTPRVAARWEVIRRARDWGWSYSHIGRALNRDHTTIIHACKKMGVA